MLFFFVFCFPDHCLYLICKAYCNSRWLINCDFFLLKSALKKNLYSWISHKSLKKKRVNSAPTSQKSRLRAECLFRKMPPRCEFRRPRFFFFFLRSSPDFPKPRRTQHEKPVWCRAASLVNGEVCILPQPAQAVVQTRRLNEAWSGQLFGSVMQSEAPLRPIVSGCAVTPGQEFCWDY